MSVNIYGSILMPLMTRTMGETPKTDHWDSNKKDSMAFFGMCFMGLGELIGGLTIGRFRDRFGNAAGYLTEIVLLLANFALIIDFNS